MQHNKTLILLVENYYSGGSDKVAKILYENLDCQSIKLFINRGNDTKVLLSGNMNKNVEIHYYNLVTIAELGTFANKTKPFLPVYVLLKFFNLLIRYPLLVFSVIYFYFKFKPLNADLFVANNGGYPGGEYCRTSTIAASLLKMKCFHIVHSMATPIFFKPFTIVENFIDRLIDKKSKIITVSLDVKSKLKNIRNIKQDIKVIDNGIEKNQQKKYLNSNNLKLLNVGSLYSLKNQLFLLDVMKRLNEMGFNNVELHLIGKEEEKGYLDKIRSLAKKYNLEDKLHIHGFCNPYEFYYECDILVHSSRVEGFPMVTLEAMSVGLPIVSTKVGGIAKQIKDGLNGFVIEQNDFNTFSKKIEFFIENRNEIKKFGNESYKLFNRSFTIDSMVKCYNNIIFGEKK